MILLDGKKLATQLSLSLKEQVSKQQEHVGLAVILVGDHKESHLYVSKKEEQAKKIGLRFEKHVYPNHVTEEVIIQKIKELNQDKHISGIIVQLPLPKSLRTKRIIQAILPEKDVDGFHPKNIYRLKHHKPCLISPVALSVRHLLLHTHLTLTGKKAVVITNTKLFATPIIHLLSQHHISCTLILAKQFKKQHKAIKDADIVIIGIGKAHSLKKEQIKNDCVVIDIGTNHFGKKVLGDVDFHDVKDIVYAITPVPGGVGPLTVSFLLANTIFGMKNDVY